MMDHAANLARVQALRAGAEAEVYEHYQPVILFATLDHIEDVLTRHAPKWAEADLGMRGYVFCELDAHTWPCPDYTSALTLLDALDGGAS